MLRDNRPSAGEIRQVPHYTPSRPARLQRGIGAPGQVGLKDNRLGTLDLLRLFAALAVVAFHFGYRGAAGAEPAMSVAFPEFAWLAKYGFLGVDLFFIISGFVIAASVEGRTVRQFAIARAARLYPAYIVCMTVSGLVLGALAMHGSGPSLAQWLANLTMFAPAFGQPFMDGAYWSIVLEVIFYGWIALFFALGIFPRHARTLIACWLAISVLNEFTWQLKAVRVLFLSEYGPLFASGVLMHMLWQGDRSRVTMLLLGIAFMLGLHHALAVEATFWRLYGDGINRSVLWLLHLGIYGVFVAALVLRNMVPASPVVLAAGGLTYPLYLVHQDVGYALLTRLEPLGGRWVALGVACAVAAAVAWCVWRYVEPGGRRIVKWLADIVLDRLGIALRIALQLVPLKGGMRWRPLPGR